jgi:hypothetical protein
VDLAGNAYLTGLTGSSDFPTTPGAFQTTFVGGFNAYVSKLNSRGSALVYSTYLGGSSTDYGPGIAVDLADNAYVTGSTDSSDFPTTAGALQTTYGGGNDAFVSKLNNSGSALVYSTYLGGGDLDVGVGIALDSSGNAFVIGGTRSSNFPATAGAFQTTLRGDSNAFVSKLSSTGSTLVYSTYLGGNSDGGLGIALDSSGNAYVPGGTLSSDFPTTVGALQTTYGGGNDAFVSKLNSSGSALVYSTYLGGSARDQGQGIALDSAGNAYVTGGTGSTNFPTTAGAFQTTYGGSGDAFISKFSFAAGIPFSHFGGRLLIDPDAGVLYLSGGFKLGPGGSIDPSTEPVTFSVGRYSVTLPPGSFVKYKTGYVYQKTVKHIFLCVFIKFTSTPGSYALLANRIGGTLTSTISPVPVTLAIGNDSGASQMNATFN